jgi:hypothetical protein
MSDLLKRRRFRLAVSLRTLWLGVTVLAIFLGYQLNWIHQRQAFLSEQLARQEAAWSQQEGNPYKKKALRWWTNQHLSDNRALSLLWPFGEPATDRLFVLIPEKDVTFRNQEYEMSSSQPDHQRAKRLFPEATICPMRWEDNIPRDSDRWFYEIQIVD